MLEREEILDAYQLRDRQQRWVRANFVASLDGAATHHGKAGPLGDPEDQRVLLALRQLADVVVVGAGTVRAEGYGGLGLDAAAVTWRRDRGLPDLPTLAIVSSALDLDPGAEVFTAPSPRPIVLTHGASPARRRERLAAVADVVLCGARQVDPVRALTKLEERGLSQVLSEGGPRLFATLVEADLVDELCLSLAPRLTAGPAGRIARGPVAVDREMRLGHALRGERILFLRYERAGPTAG